MIDDYSILPIEEKDLDRSLTVIRESFQTVADEFHLTPENCATNGAFLPYARLEYDYQQGNHMFGIYMEDQIVGFLQLVFKEGTCYELEKLAVLPAYRHNGLGKKLIAFAKNKVLELGGNQLAIGIIEENTRLKNWYQTNGFISLGTTTFPHLPFTVGFMGMALS